jgi:hypothetical protein
MRRRSIETCSITRRVDGCAGRLAGRLAGWIGGGGGHGWTGGTILTVAPDIDGISHGLAVRAARARRHPSRNTHMHQSRRSFVPHLTPRARPDDHARRDTKQGTASVRAETRVQSEHRGGASPCGLSGMQRARGARPRPDPSRFGHSHVHSRGAFTHPP